MKEKTKTKSKVNHIIDAFNKTRGRYMSMMIVTDKNKSTCISCKKISETDHYFIVQDRNNANRNRKVAKESVKAIRCGNDIIAKVKA